MVLQAEFDAVKAANRAKTEFLSNMSYDIRTPYERHYCQDAGHGDRAGKAVGAVQRPGPGNKLTPPKIWRDVTLEVRKKRAVSFEKRTEMRVF